MSLAIAVSQEPSLKNIAFVKPAITTKELKSVLECLFHDEISFGKIVEKLEAKCRETFGFKHALASSSLHSAYHLAFLAMNLQKGDEVILSCAAPLAALDAIGYLEAKPVLVDISQDAFHPDMNAITEKITEKTKAILLDYPFGSFKNFSELYEKRNSSHKDIKIIENISEIPGSVFSGKKVGSGADMAILGFEENMPITMGKGAVLLTHSKTLHNTANDLRNHSGRRSYRVRYDYTITDYQAAMGIEQLGKLSLFHDRRRSIGKLYLEAVNRSSFKTFFRYPESDGYGSFPVVSKKNAKDVITHLKKGNIETRRALPHEPLHRLIGLSPTDFPNTEKFYEKSILLPIYPHLTRKNINAVIKALKKIY